ncbi:hypothetical protein [Paenibacillus thiaminolyticus]|uniref:hypothetical protein n=1 Tax=Paenibacillus thiaminolyticus TaxID=49283 RepID=UPI002543A028|nr:hypothetical protein [Paenibacillus thiaminolyticus]WII35143.1 hypothetical protein O0V01_15620 [Paenibacillus thiaminolyticus]
MTLPINEVQLADMSGIEVKYYIGSAANRPYDEVLLIAYAGQYGFGSSGNHDARYMRAMGVAALEAWEPSGVILDWSELHYEWGDMLERVLDIGSVKYADETFPLAVIVGPHCEEAIRTLLLGLHSTDSLDKFEWIHRDRESAWRYIEAQIAAYA